jgi:hypothetical protein
MQSVAVAALTLACASAHAAVVNLSATEPSANRITLASADPQSPYAGNPSITVVFADLVLGPGAYTVTPVATPAAGALYTAANRFGFVDQCGTGGTGCKIGWEHNYWVKVGTGSAATPVGSAPAGGIGPHVGGAYFASDALAFGNAAGTTLNIAAANTNVRFYWLDDHWNDNQGGLSLNVTPVPEPHEWAMLLAGLGMVGAIARRRRRAAS